MISPQLVMGNVVCDGVTSVLSLVPSGGSQGPYLTWICRFSLIKE